VYFYNKAKALTEKKEKAATAAAAQETQKTCEWCMFKIDIAARRCGYCTSDLSMKA